MSLDDRFRQALEGALAEVRTRLETEFTSTLSDVRTEAERDRAAALAALDERRVSELAAADEARKADLTAAAEAQAMAMQAFQSEKDALTTSHQSLLSELRQSAEGDAVRVRDELAAEFERVRAAATAASDSALALLRAELQHVLADGARQREVLEAGLATAKQEAIDAADRATLERDAALAQARAEHDAVLAQTRAEHGAALATFRDDHDGALTTARREAQEAASAHSSMLDEQLTGAIRLLESVRGLDGASSLTDVLDSLTIAAAKEAGRSAMLVVKGDRLIGWRTSGFGSLDATPRSIESSTADVGALAAAVNTGRTAVVGSGSVLAAPSFSQLSADRPGLAVPLLVAGRPVAVLYADPGTSAAAPSSGWASPVEVLVRHAGRCLEAIAVQRGAHAKAAARVGTPA